jgi:hypothetical protein
MDTSEQLDLLINTFKKEDPRFNDLEIPEAYPEKRQLFRSLMTILPPRPVSNEFLNIQDEFLLKETLSKGIVDGIGLPTIANHSKFSLWQGDITTLKVDAIVNAANSQMLGCFVPGHQCIDNVIHSAAKILHLYHQCQWTISKGWIFRESNFHPAR